MFGIDAGNRLFDNGLRELGGVPRVRPAWEDTPASFPFGGLPWLKVYRTDVLFGTGVQDWNPEPYSELPLGAHNVTGTEQPAAGTQNGQTVLLFDGVDDYLYDDDVSLTMFPLTGWTVFTALCPHAFTYGNPTDVIYEGGGVWVHENYDTGLSLYAPPVAGGTKLNFFAFAGAAEISLQVAATVDEWVVSTARQDAAFVFGHEKNSLGEVRSAAPTYANSSATLTTFYGRNPVGTFGEVDIGVVAVAPSGSWPASRRRDIQRYLLDAYGSSGGAQSLLPTGVSGAVNVRQPTLARGAVNMAPSRHTGVPSVGAPTLARGAVQILPAQLLDTPSFGAPMLLRGAVSVLPTRLLDTPSFGAPTLVRGAVTLLPTVRSSTASIGAPTLVRGAVVLGTTRFTGSASVGAPVLVRGAVTLLPTLLTDAPSIGAPTVQVAPVTLGPTRVSVPGSVGAPTLARGAVTIAPTLFDLPGSVGAPTLARGAVTLQPSRYALTVTYGAPRLGLRVVPARVDSAATVGAPALARGPVQVLPSLLGGSAAFGSPTLLPGPRTVAPAAVVATTSVGSPMIVLGAATLLPAAIGGAVAIGAPTLLRGAVQVVPTRVTSPVSVGAPTLARGTVFIGATAYVGSVTVGAPSLLRGAALVLPTRHANAPSFGSPTLHLQVRPSAIGSLVSVGAPSLLPGGVVLSPNALTVGVDVGAPAVSAGGSFVNPSAHHGAVSVGAPSVVVGGVILAPTVVAGASDVGAPTLSTFVTVSPAVVAAGTTVGAPTIGSFTSLSVSRVESELSIGAPSLVRGAVAIVPTRVDPTSAIGVPSIAPGPVSILPLVTALAPSVGAPTVTSVVRVEPLAIPSGASVGTPALGMQLRPSALVGIVAFGLPVLAPGIVTIHPNPVASTLAIGLPTMVNLGLTTLGELRSAVGVGALITVLVSRPVGWVPRVERAPWSSLAASSTSWLTTVERTTTLRSEVLEMELHVGDDARVTTTITVDGVLTDPSALSLEVTRPGGVTSTLVYPGTIERVSIGVFRATIDCTLAGTYRYRWVSPGPAAKGAERGYFDVEP